MWYFVVLCQETEKISSVTALMQGCTPVHNLLSFVLHCEDKPPTLCVVTGQIFFKAPTKAMFIIVMHIFFKFCVSISLPLTSDIKGQLIPYLG